MSHEITLAGGAGEYMESATVVSWSAKVGDPVKAGDVVVVVETAKAATEIEAGCDGVLAAILAPEGAEVGIGAVLGRIADSLAADEVAFAASQPAIAVPEAMVPNALAKAETASRRISISPLARRLARQAGLDTSGIAGTGPGGRIKSRDIERALQERTEAAPATAPVAVVHSPVVAKAGPAVPLVLLHGFGANAAAWNMVRPHLDGRPVLTPELPGHGREPALETPSLEELAEAVLGQIEASGARECDLVGHSLGGAVAAVLAANQSVRVRSLTLIAPAGLGPEIDSGFLAGFLSARTAESLAPWLERLAADPARLPRGYAQAMLRERERFSVGVAQAEIAQKLFPDGTQAIRITADLDRFAGSLKVIWGRGDRIIPQRHQDELPSHAACHRLAGVGHMPYLEAPALVAQLILQNVRSAEAS
ncbi:Pyruvate dehydrogenase E2 component (Dihydrolipoamide acetyltransferase) [Bosea sp. 62]|uniref:acetoin dehydrogenase dihydrolipoyllysine-residue acetyltransferase subunit n=1 Tax=unclassified Bosea (in: a-proteobacteria) TaxID=2653178 RepID=UPI0012592DB7|nr:MULTISPECIES: acetoin dehydrogenase dihydrolipoyllysine-residue acetyltransferase subunit [unclassified Bosea (in: a-proteobacteria)]CAD5256328.1 Pyruvate dehydrogenase E2 component (Dihydrolipoamide acetyltransferase) [Bosea sp. 7B]CAD5274245.1 Pyruvate dehydrogenase E2 component (Dihydrolipoamide acetyltransferase) [Bosea sp. 21B]CAD5275445.1 Pyruvate dehydrogenase E2 component (Dihydrolipoamide acetyltransferase) [Bosea sp. 46]VVT60119.1 Pyruvate dehydrogenase E2 component (Dihydrolipoami